MPISTTSTEETPVLPSPTSATETASVGALDQNMDPTETDMIPEMEPTSGMEPTGGMEPTEGVEPTDVEPPTGGMEPTGPVEPANPEPIMGGDDGMEAPMGENV